MAGVQGRNGRNTEKLSVIESNVPAVGFKATRALHEATVGDSTIDLTNLIAPATATANGYNPPTASDLQKVSLRQFKNNLTLRTGSTTLIQDIDFVVQGARTIKLTVAATAAQIFELIINAEPRIGTPLVDGAPLISTGTLLNGTTDYNVGSPFKVGQYPTRSVGAVQVFSDGVLQKRNVGNQSGGAGDYYEVHAGAGLGVIVRFNATSGSDRDISVVSVGSLVERPDGTQDAYLDTLAGQIDVIRTEVETQHAITIPIGAPNNIDLKAFGDRVLTLENAGGGGGHVIEDEGAVLPQQANMNFVGAGVTVTDSGGKTVVTIAGGSAPVDSVNTQTGAVVLDADDISDTATTNKFTTASDISKLAGIESGATADQTDVEIETAYNAQVSLVSQAEAEAGVATTIRTWTSLRVKQAIAALAPASAITSVNTQTGTVVLDTDDVAEGATNNYSNTAGGQSDITGNADVSANTTHRGVTTGNPHSVSKSDVGLSNLTNDAQVPLSQKGAASGVATLDASSRIPAAQLPTSATEYKGAWNATTNTPALIDGSGTNGDMYRVDTAGTQDLGSGSISYSSGDVVIYNGTIWERIPANDLVASVNSQIGVVVLDADDLSDAATTQKFTSASDISKLAGIESGATADQTDVEIETAYNAQVAVVTQAEAEAGTLTTIKRWTPQRVSQAIAALASTSAPVASVNTQTGVVVLDADDISDTATTNKFTTAGDISKLAGIESGATADQTDVEIETAYNTQVAVVTQAEAEAGTLTTIKRWTPQRVSQAIANLAGAAAPVASVNTQTGAVVLDADDISDTLTTNKFTTAGDISKLAGIETAATTDQTNVEIETAYNAQVAIVTQAEAEAGTLTTVKRWTPQRVSQAIAALASTSAPVASVNTQTGVVVLDTDDVAEGATNNYANTAGGQSDISGNTDVAANTTHRGVVAGNPHAVTNSDVGLGNVSNDAQVPLSQKASANGVATLDGTSRIPAAQLPISVMEYKGAWNATTNTPTLIDGTGTNGDTYRTSVAGTQDLGAGSISYSVGDAVIYNGTIWERIPADDSVLSVNSQTGVVVLDADDLSDAATTNKFTTATETSKLAGIESGATADQTDVEIETAYNTQVAVVTQAEAEAGTLTTVKRWTPQRVAQAIAALETGGGGGLSNVVEDLTPQLGGDLDVNGNNLTSSTGLDIAIGSAAGNDFTIDTDKLVVEGDTGNVGIGTGTPFASAALQIERNANTTAQIFLNNSNAGALAKAQLSVQVDSGPAVTVTLASYPAAASTTGSERPSGSAVQASGASGLSLAALDATAGDIRLYTGGGLPAQESLTILVGGNVGVGVADPDERLEVAGRIHLGQVTAPGTTTDKLYNVGGVLTWNGSVLATGSTGIGNVVEDLTPQLGGDLDVNGNNLTSSTGLDIAIGSAAGNDFTIDTDKLVVEGDTGNVGIGTATPNTTVAISNPVPSLGLVESGATLDSKSWKLVAAGETLFGQVVNDANSIGTNWLVVDRTGITVDTVAFPNGNVGIGTATPGARLEVESSTSPILRSKRISSSLNGIVGNTRISALSTGNMADGFGPLLAFEIGDDTQVLQEIAQIGAVRSGADNSGALVLRTVDAGIGSEAVRILPTGNIGIGVTDPDEQLEITGRMHIGQTTAPGTTTDKLYNVAGALTWNGMDLTAGGGGADNFSTQLTHVRHSTTFGSNAPNLASGLNIRPLNELVTNEISGASLTSNQITLPAGTYYAEGFAVGQNCSRHRAWLYNVTGSAIIVEGSTGNAPSSHFSHNHSLISGRFTLAATSVVEMRQQPSSSATNGMGTASGINNYDLFADLKIWKVA